MKVKKLLSLLSAGAMALTSLTGAMTFTASAANEDDYFTYAYQNFPEGKGYGATLKTDADFSSLVNGELIVPDTFNDDGTNGELPVVLVEAKGLASGNNTIKSIKTKSPVSSIGVKAFQYLNALEKVEYTTTGTLTFKSLTFDDCSDTLKDVYINASEVTFTGNMGKRAFNGFIDNTDAKIHVMSDGVKQQIINGTAGNVTEDKIEVVESELPTPVVTVECEDITFGTKGGFKPTVTVKVDGQPVDNPNVTIKMYRNQDCTDEYSGVGGYTSDSIPVGTYYFKAIVEGTDTYASAMSEPLEVKVTEAVIDKTNLNKAIEDAESFKKSAVENDYDPEAWKDVFSTAGKALVHAKNIANDTLNQYTQDEIDAATNALNEAMDKLKKSPADTTEVWAELQELITNAESIGDDYTAESYANVESVLKDAKALSKETATKTAIDDMITKIKKAMDEKLVGVIPAGEPFVKVYKNGKIAIAFDGTADDAMAGAASIKFTFDCASDVNFSSYASIELQADVDGEKSYVKNIGNNKTTGAEDCLAVLKLTNPIKAGQNVNLTVWTYSWEDASDYVYGITKVEFIDAKGHIVKTINDVSFAKDGLASVIEKAKAVEAEKDMYTAESLAVLTKAIEAAEALKDDATAADINAAASAITAAIQGLKYKTPDVDNPKPGNNNNNTSTTKPSNKTPNVKSQAQKNAEKAMKQAKITKLKVKSKAKKKITVTWKKVSKAKGYQVQVSTNKKFKKSKIILTKTTKKIKLTITKKLKSKKKYFVRVRAYTTYKAPNGKTNKVYSDWNKKLRTVKVK